MARTFSVDPGRLAAFRARADEARGAARLAQQRVEAARDRLRQAEDELRRTERARPGQPAGVVRVDADGRRRGTFESQHETYIVTARRRVEAARAELDQLFAEQADSAGRREHDVQLHARLERHVAEQRTAR